MEEKKIFAKGYCFPKIFIFFVLGCLFGTFYEEILWLISHGELTNRQGLIYGPFSPIYGVGVAIYVIILGKNNDKRNLLHTFVYSAIIGGVTEFMTSFIAEFCFGVQFWDYSNQFLNIAGRTTIPFIFAWGLMGTVLMKAIYPFISKWIEKIPYKVAMPIYIIVLTLLTIDIIITYSAFGRMAFRNQGKEPLTFVGEIYDKYYTNEFMNDKFPAMSQK